MLLPSIILTCLWHNPHVCQNIPLACKLRWKRNIVNAGKNIHMCRKKCFKTDEINIYIDAKNTGLQNYWHSQKRTVPDSHILYKHCITLYMHCKVLLTWTVHHWTSLYIHTDSYCTALNSTVRRYWSTLYRTEHHCTGILIYTL